MLSPFVSHRPASMMRSCVPLHTHSLHDSEADCWNWRTSISHNESFSGICWMFSRTALNSSTNEWAIVRDGSELPLTMSFLQWSAISWPESANWQWIQRMLCTLPWWPSSHRNHSSSWTVFPSSTNSSIAAPLNSTCARGNGCFGSFPMQSWIPAIMGPFAECKFLFAQLFSPLNIDFLKFCHWILHGIVQHPNGGLLEQTVAAEDLSCLRWA